MIDHIQRRMIGHAALILFIGMLAGFGLLVSLIGGIELIPGTVIPISIFGGTDAWVRAHTGGILNALLILSFASNRFGHSTFLSAIGLGPALLFVFISLFAVGLLVHQAFGPRP